MQQDIFTGVKTIAIVGLSTDPQKPSHEVAKYLQKEGFIIIPVNPHVSEVLGEKAYPDLLSVPKEIHLDVIDVFRRSDVVLEIIIEVITRGDAKTIWLQEGIEDPDAEAYARNNGFTVVSNFCLMKAHKYIQ